MVQLFLRIFLFVYKRHLTLILTFYPLDLLLALLEAFLEVLLENVSFYDSLFVLVILKEKFLKYLIAEAELIYTVLELFLCHDVAFSDRAHTLHCEFSLGCNVNDFFHSENLIFAEQKKRCLFWLMSCWNELFGSFADLTA